MRSTLVMVTCMTGEWWSCNLTCLPPSLSCVPLAYSRTSGVRSLHDLVLFHNSRKSGVLLDDKNVNNFKQNVVVSKALKISQIAQIC